MTTAVHEHEFLDRPPTVNFPASGECQYAFMAFLPTDVYERKMFNAIAELDAKVISIEESLVRLQIGRKAWLRQYTADDLPVELTVRICGQTVSSSSMTHVDVEIKPLVRVRRRTFEKRCYFLTQTLRSCLAGEELAKRIWQAE